MSNSEVSTSGLKHRKYQSTLKEIAHIVARNRFKVRKGHFTKME